jgi:DnaJ-class molecular chaperone
VIGSPCGDCYGKGVVRRQKTLSAKIPAGNFDLANQITCATTLQTSNAFAF